MFLASDLSLANPVMSAEAHKPQPAIFQGKLKEYQLKVLSPSLLSRHSSKARLKTSGLLMDNLMISVSTKLMVA